MGGGFVFKVYSTIAINLLYSDPPNNSARSLQEIAVESVPATSLERGVGVRQFPVLNILQDSSFMEKTFSGTHQYL